MTLPILTLDDLQRVHPLWLEHRDLWTDAEILRGGQWDFRRHLVKGTLEPSQDFETRKKLTRVVPEFPAARARICGAVCADQPDRSELPEPLLSWSQSVDASGRSIGAWIESVAIPIMLDYGSAHVIAQPPPVDDPDEIETLADLAARGAAEPRLVAMTPLQLRNWSLGTSGNLQWAIVVEETWTVVGEGAFGRRVPTRRYHVFDRDEFAVYESISRGEGGVLPELSWTPDGDVDRRAGTGEEELLDPAPAARPVPTPGRVPIVSFVAEPLAEMVGASMVRNAITLDLQRLNLESDQAFDLHLHAHPILRIRSKKSPEEIGFGSSQALHLDPGGPNEQPEDASYLELGAESFQARERAIQKARSDAQRQLGADPVASVSHGDDGAGVAISGVSRAISYKTTEGRHILGIRDRVEAAENALLRVVAEQLGSPLPDGENLVAWPRKLDVSDASSTIDTMAGLKLSVRSETARREAEKRIVTAALGDDLPLDVRRAINREIDTSDPPRTPAFAFSDSAEGDL